MAKNNQIWQLHPLLTTPNKFWAINISRNIPFCANFKKTSSYSGDQDLQVEHTQGLAWFWACLKIDIFGPKMGVATLWTPKGTEGRGNRQNFGPTFLDNCYLEIKFHKKIRMNPLNNNCTPKTISDLLTAFIVIIITISIQMFTTFSKIWRWSYTIIARIIMSVTKYCSGPKNYPRLSCAVSLRAAIRYIVKPTTYNHIHDNWHWWLWIRPDSLSHNSKLIISFTYLVTKY